MALAKEPIILLASKTRITTGLAVPLLIAVLLAVRGGFGGEVTCACGLAALCVAACLLVKRKSGVPGVGPMPLLLSGLAAAYLAGGAVHGMPLVCASEAGTWAGVAGVSIVASLQDTHRRESALDWLCRLGALSSVVGMLVFCEALEWQGGVAGGRLQFPMTYANASGAWFAAAAFLCLFSERPPVRLLSPLPVAALALTGSGGALAAFAVAAAVLAFFWLRSGRRGEFAFAAACAAAGVALALCVRILPPAASAACALAAAAACIALGRAAPGLAAPPPSKKAAVAVTGACLAALALSAASMAGRAAEAASDFSTRLAHVADGLSLLSQSPLLGVGPDCWQFLYQRVQTAAYRTTVVHCSYVQVALDSGVVGLCLLAAALACGFAGLIRARDLRSGLPAGLVAAHALVDFDLQFGSLAFLLAFLATPARKLESSAAAAPRRVAALLLAVLLAASCAFGLAASVARSQVLAACARGDFQQAAALYEDNPMAQDDPEMRAAWLESLRASGRSLDAAYDVARRGVWYDRQAIAGAWALYDVGDAWLGAQAMVEELERCPYDEGLFEAAADLFGKCGLPEDFEGRYEAALARSGELRGA